MMAGKAGNGNLFRSRWGENIGFFLSFSHLLRQLVISETLSHSVRSLETTLLFKRCQKVTESWQTTLGTLWSAAWPGLGKGPLVARLVHQRRSSWPHFSLPCPIPLQCPALHRLELALRRHNPATPHLTPMPCASCLLPPARGTQYPEPTHVQTRSGRWHPMVICFPSSPRMTSHFIRTKQLTKLPSFLAWRPATATQLISLHLVLFF
ncbi:PREDICTED: uncharacterized protein LOC106727548 isoform X2 [Myotis brandtii]|uniref:uncharacterized protein LOC106727548 isoform X2 n=1 Tax=Myotis brandtii TaxID=109478 RepID=UPI0007047DFE|nr:PREDICTED: uncharacterized protein LOC106727548 isoform X2 [Myotis brandtii]